MTAGTAEIRRRSRRALAREFGGSVVTIMVKELRSRFRGRRAFVVLTIYLGILALIAYGGYAVIAPNVQQQQFGGFGFSAATASATIGTAIFVLLSLFQLLLVCFIAPAFTTGAISLEREKQTLDLLISTPMRPGAIVIGKLLSALAFVGLMILAAIPLSALVLMYGGATIEDIARQQVVLLVTALGFGAIGLFYSALIKRTQAATVLTYCTMLVLTVGTALLWVFWSVVGTPANEMQVSGGPRPAPEQILWVNPGLAMFDVIAHTESDSYGAFTTVVDYAGGMMPGTDTRFEPAQPQPMPVPGGPVFNGPTNGLGAAPPSVDAAAGVGLQPVTMVGHFWTRFSLTIGALSILLTLLSMRLVVPAGMRFAFRRRRDGPRQATSGEGDPGIEEVAP